MGHDLNMGGGGAAELGRNRPPNRINGILQPLLGCNKSEASRGQQKQATVDSLSTPNNIYLFHYSRVFAPFFSPLKPCFTLAATFFPALLRVPTLACYKRCMFCLCELIKTHFCPAPVISLPAAHSLSAQLTKLDVIRIHEKCFFLFSAGTISRRGQAGGPRRRVRAESI